MAGDHYFELCHTLTITKCVDYAVVLIIKCPHKQVLTLCTYLNIHSTTEVYYILVNFKQYMHMYSIEVVYMLLSQQYSQLYKLLASEVGGMVSRRIHKVSLMYVLNVFYYI